MLANVIAWISSKKTKNMLAGAFAVLAGWMRGEVSGLQATVALVALALGTNLSQGVADHGKEKAKAEALAMSESDLGAALDADSSA